MGRKCCVYGCKTNYASEKGLGADKFSVYRFPKERDKEAWVSVIPNDKFVLHKESVVCELHWPSGFETINFRGKKRPKNPPSVWPNIPSSQTRTPGPPPRSTKNSSTGFERNRLEDELCAFQERDNVTFSVMKDTLLANTKDLPVPVISFMDCEILHIQSRKFLSGVPMFMTRIFSDQMFENFHAGVRCTTTSLSKNRITKLKTWSALEENLRCVTCVDNTVEQPLQRKKELSLELCV